MNNLILQHLGTNIGWSAWVIEEAIFWPALPGASRLSGDMIRQMFYIGTGPTTATLSVATTNEFTVRLAYSSNWHLLLKFVLMLD